MFDTQEELLRQIRLGEDTSLEFKDVRFRGARVSAPKRNELADEIAAMANTHDGVLARIDHRFGNEGDFGRPERFSESFAIDPVQVE